jgi:5-methylthioribose kinase
MSLSENEHAQMLASLRRMGLAGPHEAVTLQPLTGGVSSLIVLATPAGGPVCVKTALPQLRVAAQWLAPVERNHAEVAWLRWVAGIVPERVPEVLGEDPVGHAFAMTWLDPERRAARGPRRSGDCRRRGPHPRGHPPGQRRPA